MKVKAYEAPQMVLVNARQQNSAHGICPLALKMDIAKGP